MATRRRRPRPSASPSRRARRARPPSAARHWLRFGAAVRRLGAPKSSRPSFPSRSSDVPGCGSALACRRRSGGPAQQRAASPPRATRAAGVAVAPAAPRRTGRAAAAQRPSSSSITSTGASRGSRAARTPRRARPPRRRSIVAAGSWSNSPRRGCALGGDLRGGVAAQLAHDVAEVAQDGDRASKCSLTATARRRRASRGAPGDVAGRRRLFDRRTPWRPAAEQLARNCARAERAAARRGVDNVSSGAAYARTTRARRGEAPRCLPRAGASPRARRRATAVAARRARRPPRARRPARSAAARPSRATIGSSFVWKRSARRDGRNPSATSGTASGIARPALEPRNRGDLGESPLPTTMTLSASTVESTVESAIARPDAC